MRKKVLYANANDPVGKVRVYECLCGLSIQRREALEAVARAAKELADFNDQYLKDLVKNKIEWNAKDAESPYVRRIKLALAELDRWR